LHVTQKSSVLEINDAPTTSATFDLKAPSVPARPYANLSTWRQVLLMLVAFACAGGLLVAVHYGNRITTVDKKYWPLQRTVEFVAVIVGAYWAYVVVLIKPYKPVSNAVTKTPMDKSKESRMSIDAFVAHYNVQHCRANWEALWADITAGMTTTMTPKIGVYVSGPKTLSRVVDTMANSTLFDVHHEEFEM
ncbi:hypothetical protein ACHHYP_06087, partial [Achlya hypogyna]